jgi:D-alanyl-D-alanine carboxypeptidase (penicillin-binding protein 5/6)
VPLSFAAPRREIILGSQPPKAAIANLYAFPSQPPQPNQAAQPNPPQQPSQPADSWSIQVATAGSREAASALLERALPVVSKAYAKAAPSIETYAQSGKEYFRARFAGFADREAAQGACALLKSKSVNCFVVR